MIGKTLRVFVVRCNPITQRDKPLGSSEKQFYGTPNRNWVSKSTLLYQGNQ